MRPVYKKSEAAVAFSTAVEAEAAIGPSVRMLTLRLFLVFIAVRASFSQTCSTSGKTSSKTDCCGKLFLQNSFWGRQYKYQFSDNEKSQKCCRANFYPWTGTDPIILSEQQYQRQPAGHCYCDSTASQCHESSTATTAAPGSGFCSTSGKTVSKTACCGTLTYNRFYRRYTYTFSVKEKDGKCCRDNFYTATGNTKVLSAQEYGQRPAGRCFCDSTSTDCHDPSATTPTTTVAPTTTTVAQTTTTAAQTTTTAAQTTTTAAQTTTTAAQTTTTVAQTTTTAAPTTTSTVAPTTTTVTTTTAAPTTTTTAPTTTTTAPTTTADPCLAGREVAGNDSCGQMYVYYNTFSLYIPSEKEKDDTCCRVNQIVSKTAVPIPSSPPGQCYCKPTTTTTTSTTTPVPPLCPELPSFSSRVLGGETVDKCTVDGVLKFVSSNVRIGEVCNGVYVYNPNGGNKQPVPLVYLPTECKQSMESLKSGDLKILVGDISGKYNNITFNPDEDIVLSGDAVPKVSYMLPKPDVLDKGSCQKPACVYNPATMSSAIDFTKCFLTSFGSDKYNEATMDTQKSGALNKVSVTKGCTLTTPVDGTECFAGVGSKIFSCVGDLGAPVYCSLKETGETVLYGLVATSPTCRQDSTFPVIPIAP